MITSVCVLGNSPETLKFIQEYKALKYYKKRDSDTEGVRIHVLHVEDPDLLSKDVTMRYQLNNGNYANVLNDGTKGTAKESTISNDTEWLLESNGHDTVVEFSEDPDKYLNILISLISRGYTTYITSDKYLTDHKVFIDEAAKSSGAKVVFLTSIEDILSDLDISYKNKLSIHRKNLLSNSLDCEPCGLL